MAEPLRVKELLKKIKAGAKRGNIQQDDVEEALGDETFLTTDGLLTADDNGVQLAFIAWAILQWNPYFRVVLRARLSYRKRIGESGMWD